MKRNLHAVILTVAVVSVFAVWVTKSILRPASDRPKGEATIEDEFSTDGDQQNIMAAVQAQIEHLQELEKDDPDNPEILAALGNVYYDAGLAKQAVAYYDRVLAIQPGNVDAMVDKATMLRALGRPQEAVDLLGKTVELAPAHELAWFNLGVINLGDLKDSTAALDAWKRFLAISSDSVHAAAVREEVQQMEAQQRGGLN